MCVSLENVGVWRVVIGREVLDAHLKDWEVVSFKRIKESFAKNTFHTYFTGCCKQLWLQETNKSSDFFYSFSTFLGFWYQVYWCKTLTNPFQQGRNGLDRGIGEWETTVQEGWK